MSHRLRSRVIAAIALAASITIIAGDVVRTSIQAREQSLTLLAELEQIPTPAGVQRLGVGRFHKARLASVTARYVAEMSRQRVFDHYRAILKSRGWSPCGRVAAGDTDHARSATASEVLCRDEYRANVAWPSAAGPGTYSVTLKWDRVTFGVWLIGGALLWLAGFSALVLARGSAGWRRAGGRRAFRLRTTLSLSECVARLAAAAAAGNMAFRPGPATDDQMIAFGLSRREGRFAMNAFAPYFYGILVTARESGSTVDGYFGFRPETRALGAVLIAVLTIMFGFAVSDDPAWHYEDMLPPILFAIMLVVGGRWMRRGDRRDIVGFLRTNLDGMSVSKLPAT